MKIFVEGEAKVYYKDGDWADEGADPVYSLSALQSLVGAVGEEEELSLCWTSYDELDMFVGGNCSFFIQEGLLWIRTVFETVDPKHIPSADELGRLTGVTSDQWSDGWGKVFEQIMYRGYYVSPWFYDQETMVRVQ